MHKKIAFKGFLVGLVTSSLIDRAIASACGVCSFGILGVVLIGCLIVNIVMLVHDIDVSDIKEQ